MNELRWEMKVPLWRNRLIRNQLGLAIGIPFGLLTMILLLAKAYFSQILYRNHPFLAIKPDQFII